MITGAFWSFANWKTISSRCFTPSGDTCSQRTLISSITSNRELWKTLGTSVHLNFIQPHCWQRFKLEKLTRSLPRGSPSSTSVPALYTTNSGLKMVAAFCIPKRHSNQVPLRMIGGNFKPLQIEINYCNSRSIWGTLATISCKGILWSWAQNPCWVQDHLTFNSCLNNARYLSVVVPLCSIISYHIRLVVLSMY